MSEPWMSEGQEYVTTPESAQPREVYPVEVFAPGWIALWEDWDLDRRRVLLQVRYIKRVIPGYSVSHIHMEGGGTAALASIADIEAAIKTALESLE